jgi:hypothetical protein
MQQAGSSTIDLPLFQGLDWEGVKAIVYRYRGRVALSTEQKRELILKAATADWLLAEDIATRTRLPVHSCAKLLVSLAEAGELECKVQEWVDHKHRNRRRSMYRLPRRPAAAGLGTLMRALGLCAKPRRAPKPAGCVHRHRMEG